MDIYDTLRAISSIMFIISFVSLSPSLVGENAVIGIFIACVLYLFTSIAEHHNI